ALRAAAPRRCTAGEPEPLLLDAGGVRVHVGVLQEVPRVVYDPPVHPDRAERRRRVVPPVAPGVDAGAAPGGGGVVGRAAAEGVAEDPVLPLGRQGPGGDAAGVLGGEADVLVLDDGVEAVGVVAALGGVGVAEVEVGRGRGVDAVPAVTLDDIGRIEGAGRATEERLGVVAAYEAAPVVERDRVLDEARPRAVVEHDPVAGETLDGVIREDGEGARAGDVDAAGGAAGRAVLNERAADARRVVVDRDGVGADEVRRADVLDRAIEDDVVHGGALGAGVEADATPALPLVALGERGLGCGERP